MFSRKISPKTSLVTAVSLYIKTNLFTHQMDLNNLIKLWKYAAFIKEQTCQSNYQLPIEESYESKSRKISAWDSIAIASPSKQESKTLRLYLVFRAGFIKWYIPFLSRVYPTYEKFFLRLFASLFYPRGFCRPVIPISALRNTLKSQVQEGYYNRMLKRILCKSHIQRSH